MIKAEYFSYLAFVNWNLVGELCPVSDVEVVPAHEADGLSVMVLLGRVEGQRVGAVIGDVLTRLRRKQLQETYLKNILETQMSVVPFQKNTNVEMSKYSKAQLIYF